MRRKGAYLALGIVMFVFTLLLSLLLWKIIAEAARWGYSPWRGGDVVLALDLLVALPMVASFWLWRREARNDKELRSVSAILQTYQDIPIPELAQRLGKTPAEAEALVGATVAAGYAQGFIDRATGTFRRAMPGAAPTQIHTEVVTRERVLVRCRFCDALMEQGQAKCGACGAPQS